MNPANRTATFTADKQMNTKTDRERREHAEDNRRESQPLGWSSSDGGAVRLTQLAVGVQITPENARLFAMPLPVVVHIVSAGMYAILGAFQFTARFGSAGPAGTGKPGGSWSFAGCWWVSQGCG